MIGYMSTHVLKLVYRPIVNCAEASGLGLRSSGLGLRQAWGYALVRLGAVRLGATLYTQDRSHLLRHSGQFRAELNLKQFFIAPSKHNPSGWTIVFDVASQARYG